jgi:hypothetical protein
MVSGSLEVSSVLLPQSVEKLLTAHTLEILVHRTAQIPMVAGVLIREAHLDVSRVGQAQIAHHVLRA